VIQEGRLFSEFPCEINRSFERKSGFLSKMKLPVLSLKFLVAFYHYYCAQIPEQIEELRGVIVGSGGGGGGGGRGKN